MKSKNPLDLLFYFLLLAPPQGSKKGFRSRNLNPKSYVKREILGDYLLEYFTRLGILVVIFYGITETVTKFYFDYYKLVFIIFTLILAGSVHTIAFYIHTEIFHQKYFRFYNIVRNSLYATIPGFIPVSALIVYREINQEKIFADDMPFYLYGATTLTAIGIIIAYSLLQSKNQLKR